jgi:hypothetical protein
MQDTNHLVYNNFLFFDLILFLKTATNEQIIVVVTAERDVTYSICVGNKK